MTLATLSDKHVQSALRHGVRALTRVANYALPTALDRRMQTLGEEKEFLAADDHEELMALVAFTQDRTIEKLEAEVALHEMRTLLQS